VIIVSSLLVGVAGASPVAVRCNLWAAPAGVDTNPGTKASPLQSLDRLARSLTPGQTGCLLPGSTFAKRETITAVGKAGERRITITTAPELVAVHGVGPDTAATLLVTAGDNPHRLDHEKSFAALVGACPIPVNSGQTQGRHRLNRGGDRQANSALWRITVVRLATDPDTRAYLQRRQHDGKTKSEAIRCLKRYIAREVFNALPRPTLD